MPPRIAIPMPHSTDREYGERAIPQFERAVALVGGEPVRILLNQTPGEIKKVIDGCDAVLLPGSNADIDPARFKQERSPHTAKADPRRDDVDVLLLDDAYTRRKPVLGICYGLQSLNVYHKGSLIQHIPEFLPEETRTKVNHEAGKKVAVAHTVEVDRNSYLARIVGGNPDRARQGLSRAGDGHAADRALAPEGSPLVVPVNSSHHQSADAIGEGLRVVGHCPDDGIIEALEGTAQDHFVLAVQWHPERSVDDDAASRNIFRALIDAALGR
ncbi:MAG TPA: gamma-glutamyl-gamma-aminobutyrate hydrolase family protein [Candidatus Dormibacteraeota bacterium]|nr:gamma-glutamyl-gamma-aminobutyrate hydrolase family protein [Candidatus Dormibacteraeota bacterium]